MIEWNGKLCIMVSGYLHGPLRRKHPLLSSSVKFVLVPPVFEKREVWLEQIRARIAPWKLLEQFAAMLSSDNMNEQMLVKLRKE